MIYAEIAHHMALIPLFWLVLVGHDLDVGWWLIAIGFAVSWAADTAAHVVEPWAVTLSYPVLQSSIIGGVLLPSRAAAMRFTILLVITATLAVLWRGVRGPDVLLCSVAWLGVAAIAWRRWELGRLRVALVVYFGLGLVAWWVHAAWLIVPTWYPFQLCRAAGLLLFCWASLERPQPLRLVA